MLKFTQAQLGSRIASEGGFAQWYVDAFMPEHLADFHSQFGRAKLLAVAVRARRLALRFGFTDPGSQTHFVSLMWRLGGNFFLFPGYREIVGDTQTDGVTRIDRIYAEVTPDQAADAILNGHDGLLFESPLDDAEACE